LNKLRINKGGEDFAPLKQAKKKKFNLKNKNTKLKIKTDEDELENLSYLPGIHNQ